MFGVPALDHPIIATELDQVDNNICTRGRYAFEANFRSGLRILDISDPTAPASAAYFDGFPSDDASRFNGAWSNYPYFPSGTVVVSGLEQKLFVLPPTFADWPPAPPLSQAPEELYLGDLTGQATDQPDGRWLATVTATVRDADENPAEGVTVDASWSTGASGSRTTGNDGQRAISFSLPNTTSKVAFKLDSLSRDSDSYVAASKDVSDTVTVSAPATGGAIVPEWVANHEDGTLMEWNNGGGLFNTNDYTVVNSAERAHTGARSIKTTIDTTGGMSAVRLFRWAESRTGADLYYSAWAYFPEYHRASWWNIFQFKSKRSSPNDNINDPIIVINVGNGGAGAAMQLFMTYHGSYLGGSDRSYSQSLNPTDLPVGRWVHLEAFLHQAGDATGVLRFWQDGTLIFDIRNIQTRYPDGDNQWSLANYSDNLNPPVAPIYFDDAVIARERVYGRSVEGMRP